MALVALVALAAVATTLVRPKMVTSSLVGVSVAYGVYTFPFYFFSSSFLSSLTSLFRSSSSLPLFSRVHATL